MNNEVRQLPGSWKEMEALYFGGKSKLESAEFVDNNMHGRPFQ